MAIEQRAYRQRAAALYALALLRFALLGFSYQPLLDDHIQYYNYANLMGALPQAVSRLGLLAARPLAGLADIAVWSRFWPCLFLALALLAALLTLSALLFERLFDEMVGTGPLFTWFFLLLPANFEATYWLSASTRVIPGLLLAACAGLCALRAEKRPWLMLAAGGCCLLAAGFYEQCFVLAAGLCALCGLFWTRRPLTKVASVVLPCAAYGVYATLCAAAGPSALYGARASLVLPFRDAAFFSQHLPQVFEQLYAVFKSIPALTLRALLRFPGVLAQTLWPALPMLLALLALLWWTTLHLDKRFSTGAREECVSSRFARPEASDKARQERALGPKEQSCTSLPADISPKKRAWLALLIGALVAIGNFAGICLVVQKIIDEQDEKRRKAKLQLSYNGRMLLQAVWVVVAIAAPCFQAFASILPLFFPRITIYYLQITGKYKPLKTQQEHVDISVEDDPAPAAAPAADPADKGGET